MAQLALSGSFDYLRYGSTAIITILILSVREPSLYVRIWRLHRRQILTYKDDPRTERIISISAIITVEVDGHWVLRVKRSEKGILAYIHPH